MKKLLCILFALFFAFSFTSCAKEEEPLRLHVIANSNNPSDQAVKLKVRDAILSLTGDVMESAETESFAEDYMRLHQEELVACANQVLLENGFSYGARVEVGRFPFPEKTYGDITYPAGDYEAVKIILGNGSGNNWWCVLFPPLCLVDTSRLSEESTVYHSIILDWIKENFHVSQ